MASVFSSGQTFKGGFRADQLTLTFGDSDVAGSVVQSIQFNYQQQVTTLYEVGSANVYLVGGRSQGTASMARVIGPASAAGDLISRYNDLCNPQDINLDTSAGCPSSGSAPYQSILKDAVLTAISGSVTAQDAVMNEQMQFIFLDMDRS